MVQTQTQPKVNQVQQPAVPAQQSVNQPVANQQTPGTTQPVEMSGETGFWKKWWFWLIIAVVIIGAGVGVYFGFFYNPAL